MGGRRSVRRSTALLASLIVLMAAAGCGGAGDPGAAESSGGSGDAAGSSQPTSSEPTAAPPGSHAAEPPGSTLGHGDRAVAGVLGSYCWSSGSAATCVDGAYNPASGGWEALAVPAGSEMEFYYGGEAPPDAVRAEAEPSVPTASSPGIPPVPWRPTAPPGAG